MRALLLLMASAPIVIGQSAGRMISSEADVVVLAFSKDGATVAGMCGDNKLRLWDTRSGGLRTTVALNKDERLAAMPAGTGLMGVAMADGSLEWRDLKTGKASRRLPAPARRPRRITTAPDLSVVAGSTRIEGNSREEVMRLWDAAGMERFAVPAGIGGTSALSISPDGKTLAAGSYDTDLRIWSTKNGELIRRVNELLVSMFAMEFTPDGKFLAAAGVDRTVYFWDTSTWKLARKLSGQPEMISAMAFSADGKMFATGGFSEFTQEKPVKILLWDTARGTVLRTLDSPRIVSSVAFSPDGKWLAAAHGRKSIQMWSTTP